MAQTLRITKGFTYRQLEDSESSYLPLMHAIYHYHCELYKANKMNGKAKSGMARCLASGYDDISLILEPIVTYNRCFYLLIELTEVKAALPLVRLQLDLLTALYAETKYPLQVLYKVYVEGKRLERVMENLGTKVSLIREELNQKYSSAINRTTIKDMYDLYSGLIHPSITFNEIKDKSYINIKSKKPTLVKPLLKQYNWAMVNVNKVMKKVLVDYLEQLKSLTK